VRIPALDHDPVCDSKKGQIYHRPSSQLQEQCLDFWRPFESGSCDTSTGLSANLLPMRNALVNKPGDNGNSHVAHNAPTRCGFACDGGAAGGGA
jgi:hypothetical protein